LNRLFYILFFCAFTVGLAQTQIAVKSDTNYVFIGDVIHVDLYVATDQNLIWPAIAELVEPLEVQDFGEIDTTKKSNKFLYHQRIALQSFDTGRFNMPSLAFASLQGDTFYSDSLALAFLAVPLDTTNAIFDIKEPIHVPFNFAEAQPYILALLAFVILLILLIYLVRKFWKKTPTVVPEVELVPCEIEAKEALTKLEAKGYLAKGKVKTHYVELTEILRHYFDREFEIDTLESTTEETIGLLKGAQVNPDIVKQIAALLEQADLVKFAKSNPDLRTSSNFMSQSFSIVAMCHEMKMEVTDA